MTAELEESALRRWLVDHLVTIIGCSPGDVAQGASFNELGVGPSDAAVLSGELSALLERPVTPVEFWRHPTVDALATALTAAEPSGGQPVPAMFEPIAVIGVGCRFPGEINGPDQLWHFLRDGRCAVDTAETTPGEPEPRMLLEVAGEALEHAGMAPAALRYSQTGVFVGACVPEHGLRDACTGPEGGPSVIATRLSHVLDLRGPSFTVDTAGSSSLVAVHLACQNLQSGTAKLALAAGTDGGSGCGVVLLQRLSDALADGTRVLAVVRGSAVNQDGRVDGLMAVLRGACSVAGVDPHDVDYVETHGTGTVLGGPAEVRALGSVLGRGRRAGHPLVIGSVKTNLGHLEGAAGIAGFLKAMLVVQRGSIPVGRYFREPDPGIPIDQLRLDVVTEPMDWPSAGRVRRAGVSSFGVGGTNASLVIEQAPRTREHRAPGTVFVYSGQGSQWPGMGQRLLAEEPAFAAAITELEPAFVAQAGFSLQQVLSRGELVHGDARVQPVLLGIQLALTALWRSHGVHPDAVIGYATGEVSAAVVAGALSVAEGLRVVTARATLLSRSAGQAVALVALDAAVAQALLARYPGVHVSGCLSPRQTVVAGVPDQVDAVIDAVTAANRFAHRVDMTVLPQGDATDLIMSEFCSALADLNPAEPAVPFFSTVADPTRPPVLDAGYWAANIGSTVQFSRAVTAAARDHTTFIEVSPHPMLTRAVTETLESSPHHHSIGTLSRDGDDTVVFRTNLNAARAVRPSPAPHAGEPWNHPRRSAPSTTSYRAAAWVCREGSADISEHTTSRTRR